MSTTVKFNPIYLNVSRLAGMGAIAYYMATHGPLTFWEASKIVLFGACVLKLGTSMLFGGEPLITIARTDTGIEVSGTTPQ